MTKGKNNGEINPAYILAGAAGVGALAYILSSADGKPPTSEKEANIKNFSIR